MLGGSETKIKKGNAFRIEHSPMFEVRGKVLVTRPDESIVRNVWNGLAFLRRD